MTVSRDEITRLRRELQELKDKHEPEIVRLVAVAIAGPNGMLEVGYTADGRRVERIRPCG